MECRQCATVPVPWPVQMGGPAASLLPGLQREEHLGWEMHHPCGWGHAQAVGHCSLPGPSRTFQSVQTQLHVLQLVCSEPRTEIIFGVTSP